MFNLKKVALATLLAPAIVIGSTYAAEPGFYIGASGGQTTVDQDAKDFGIDTNNILVVNPLDDNVFDRDGDLKIDDDDTSWKAYLGYQFVPWLAVEAGYVDFGGMQSNNRSIGGQPLEADIDLTGINAFLVGTIPIGPVDLFAKVGAIDFRTDADVKFAGEKESNSENDTQLAYGIGAAYNFGKGHWGLRVEAEGFDDNEVDDLYMLSAGITYRFFSDKAEPVAAAPVAAAPAQCPDGDGDGVCDADDQCPNTPAGTKVDSLGCDCHYTLQLQFAFDSAELTAADKAELDRIIPVLSNAKTGSIGGVIEGHTDSVGSAEYNMGLSQRRAEAVERYLESNGVSLAGRFTSEAFGKTQPIASNDTAEGRAQNRRVVIRRTDCD